MLKSVDDNNRAVFLCKQHWWLFSRDSLFICSTVVTHCSLFTVEVGRSSTGSFRLSYPRMV
jgi:hypothetical protein